MYEDIEVYIAGLKLIPVSKDILIEAARIRAKYNYRSPDAIHLATAKKLKCESFYGSDKKLRAFKDVNVKIL